MKRILVLDLTAALSVPAGAAVPWARGDAAAGDAASGTLPDIAQLARLDLSGVVRVIALVPGADVLLRPVSLPPKGDALKALPFALEDELAVDLDRLHFALGGNLGDGRRLAAVLDRDRMEAWTAAVAPLMHLPVTLTPETAALAVEPGQVAVIGRGDHDLVLTPTGGFAAQPDLLPLLLPPVLEGVGRLTVLGGLPDGFSLPDAVRVEVGPAMEGAEFCRMVLAGIGPQQPVNLLQGTYRQRLPGTGNLRLWKRAGLLAATLAGLHLGLTAIGALRLEREAAALEREAEALFRQTFPDATRIVNIRAQTRARVAAMGQGEGGGYLPLTALLFGAMGDLPGMAVESLRFEPGRGVLDVELSFAAYGEMERLRDAVTAGGGTITEGGARQEGGRTLASASLSIDPDRIAGARP